MESRVCSNSPEFPINKKDDDVKNQRSWTLLAAGWLLASLAACGGGGSSSDTGQVRVVNATLTHPSLDLLVNSTVVTSAIAKDSASAYVGVTTGSPTLQLNDAGGATALTTVAPTISKDLHTTLVAYESSGSIRISVLGDDNTAPVAGSASLRVFDAAPDAGAVDVYVTAPGTDLVTVSGPTFVLPASASPQPSTFLTFTAGTYEVRVTGPGNRSDLRLDIPSITLTSQQVVSVLLTSSVGGILVDGGTLVQQGSYAATRNSNARVRLAAAVSGSASVGATAGSVVVSAPTTSPTVGSYMVVPAASVLAVNVNGASVQVPVSTLAAGSDSTLLVYGSPAAPTVSVIADDNHLPTSSSTLKMRLINGLTGTAVPLTLKADFAQIATNVGPGAASAYGIVVGNTTMRLDVTSSSLTALYSESNLNIPNNTDFTLFKLGDAAAPAHVLLRDR